MSRERTLERLAPGKVKSGMIKAHLQWVEQTHGAAALQDLAGSLPEEIRDGLDQASATTWCPFEWVIVVDRAIVERFGGPGIDVPRELGRYSAFLNLTTNYPLFQRPDIHDFFVRSALLHRMFQDSGQVSYVRTGENSGTITHAGNCAFSALYCASAVGYYEQAILMHRGAEPSVVETACVCSGDEACAFELTWGP